MQDRLRLRQVQGRLKYPMSVERLIFSDTVVVESGPKRRSVSALVLTNAALYVLSHRNLSCQRRISLHLLSKILVSTNEPRFELRLRGQSKSLVLNTLQAQSLAGTVQKCCGVRVMFVKGGVGKHEFRDDFSLESASAITTPGKGIRTRHRKCHTV